jgi:hypothetical protein
MCIVYGILFTCWAFQSFTRKGVCSFVEFCYLLLPSSGATARTKRLLFFFSKDAFGIGLRTEKRFFSRIA